MLEWETFTATRCPFTSELRNVNEKKCRKGLRYIQHTAPGVQQGKQSFAPLVPRFKKKPSSLMFEKDSQLTVHLDPAAHTGDLHIFYFHDIPIPRGKKTNITEN